MKTFGWRSIWKNVSARLISVVSLKRRKTPSLPAKDLHYSVSMGVKVKSGVQGVERLVRAAILNDVWTVAAKGIGISADSAGASFTFNVRYYSLAADKIGQLVDKLNTIEGVENVKMLSD